MDARLVFAKTAKGENEIVSRTHKLNHVLRYALILVNGSSTVKDILDKSAGLPNIERALDYLATTEFIHTLQEVQNAGHIQRDPKSEIIALAHSMFGEQANPVIKKLSAADNSPDALSETTDACKRLIKLTIDEQHAEDFVRRSQEIIYASTLCTPA